MLLYLFIASVVLYLSFVWAEFSEKYLQVNYLQEGGYGQVFAGLRIADNFPVSPLISLLY